MFLVRLVYASTRQADLTRRDVEEILDVSVANNKQNDITGCLCFDGKYFIQCLEGPRNRVNETYDRIYNDVRHQHVVLISYNEAEERLFKDWAMGLIKPGHHVDSIFLAYAGEKGFDPYKLKINQGDELMYALSKKVPLIIRDQAA